MCRQTDAGWFSFDSEHRRARRPNAASIFRLGILGAAVFAACVFGGSGPAEALPSFARQTGQPCGTCHTDYPGLTPFGRLLKLNGYTTGGGPFRTTLFPTGTDPTRQLAAYAKNHDGGSIANPDGHPSTGNMWVPPVSAMAVFGYTHTDAPQIGIDPYNPNDNFTIPQVSLFWGGAITQHIGAFSQWTYDGRSQWSWDNQDFRYANTGRLGGMDVIYGISADNNPTMGDPWNTVPAWSFPYMSSNVAPDPGVGTLLDGTFAQAAAGAGAYAFFNNLVYLQVSGYRSINHDTLGRLGADPFGAPVIDGIAPYWRAAIEPHWGNHWLEFGTFGMYARVHPWMTVPGFENQTDPNTDRYTDIGFDTQYQYQGDNYWATLRATYIHEIQSLDASFPAGNAANPTNTLNTLKLYGSLAYGNDNRIVLSGQYFDIWGSTDPLFYAGDTNGFTVELAYIPFVSSPSPGWPWANARVGLQYTFYNKFDGDTAHAHDNNTLFLYAWLAM